MVAESTSWSCRRHTFDSIPNTHIRQLLQPQRQGEPVHSRSHTHRHTHHSIIKKKGTQQSSCTGKKGPGEMVPGALAGAHAHTCPRPHMPAHTCPRPHVPTPTHAHTQTNTIKNVKHLCEEKSQQCLERVGITATQDTEAEGIQVQGQDSSESWSQHFKKGQGRWLSR